MCNELHSYCSDIFSYKNIHGTKYIMTTLTLHSNIFEWAMSVLAALTMSVIGYSKSGLASADVND